MKITTWNANLKIRLVGEALFNLLYWMYFPFIAVYFSNGLGSHLAGLLMTVPPLTAIVFSMIGGDLADRFGRKPVMLTGCCLKAVMFAVFALSSSHWLDYLAFIGIGIGGAIYSPASDAMVADLTTGKNRRQVFAVYITANNIGAVLGPAMGAILFFQYRTELLWACTFIMVLYSVAILYAIKETVPGIATKQHSQEDVIHSFLGQWKAYRTIFSDKVFVLYIAAGVFAIIAIMQLDLYLAIYVTENVPFQTMLSFKNWSLTLSSTEIFGWMLGLNGLMFVLFVLPAAKWLKNWQDRDVFMLSSFLAGIGMFAVGLTTNIWLLLLFTVIFTFGEIIRSPVMNNFVSEYAPITSRGIYMGTSKLQFTIGRFLAPFAVIVSDWMVPISVFGLILISALVSMFLYFYVFRFISKKAA